MASLRGSSSIENIERAVERQFALLSVKVWKPIYYRYCTFATSGFVQYNCSCWCTERAQQKRLGFILKCSFEVDKSSIVQAHEFNEDFSQAKLGKEQGHILPFKTVRCACDEAA